MSLQQPQQAVQSVDKRGWLPIFGGHSECGVVTTLGVVHQTVLALVLGDQRPRPTRQTMSAVEFDVRAVGKDDRLTRVEVGGLVSVAP
jgi:hypothetical protein